MRVQGSHQTYLPLAPPPCRPTALRWPTLTPSTERCSIFDCRLVFQPRRLTQRSLAVTVATVANVTLAQPHFQVGCWRQTKPFRVPTAAGLSHARRLAIIPSARAAVRRLDRFVSLSKAHLCSACDLSRCLDVVAWTSETASPKKTIQVCELCQCLKPEFL